MMTRCPVWKTTANESTIVPANFTQTRWLWPLCSFNSHLVSSSVLHSHGSCCVALFLQDAGVFGLVSPPLRRELFPDEEEELELPKDTDVSSFSRF